jgi:hypothetical protein
VAIALIILDRAKQSSSINDWQLTVYKWLLIVCHLVFTHSPLVRRSRVAGACGASPTSIVRLLAPARDGAKRELPATAVGARPQAGVPMPLTNRR